VLLPVIANSVESLPSKKFALLAKDEEMALDVVPLMVAFIVPSTVRSPKMRAEADTLSEPEMFASNIFIWLYCYTHINT